MNNICIITSIINTPNTPFNYTNIRSVFTKDERFKQLQKTISSIREKIPLIKIMIVECSILNDMEYDYLINNVDYLLNIYKPENLQLINDVYSNSKALGEGTMTIQALNYLYNNNIHFNNLFKISGRYWLNNNFNIELYNNNKTVIHKINDNNNNFFTCFYKLNKNYTDKWFHFLTQNYLYLLNGHIGFENVFANFINQYEYSDIIFINKVGINGYVSVCGTFIDM